jgi:hypothetical protein
MSPLEEWWSWYSDRRARAVENRVAVFVRSLAPAPGGHSDRIRRLELLDRLVGRGLVDDFDVTVLGKQVCTCNRCLESEPNGSVCEMITELMEWGFGVLEPRGFRKRAISSSLTSEAYSTVVLPEFSLGVYLDDELAGVFPCGTDDASYGPDSFLESVEERSVY